LLWTIDAGITPRFILTYGPLDHVSSWFWGAETARTCWYDLVELYRQSRISDCAPVLEAVHARLERMVKEQGKGG